MSFARPLVLLLLILPLLLCVWEWQRRGHRLILPLDHTPGRRGRWLGRIVTPLQWLPHLLLAVAILLLAGPRRLGIPTAERELTNIQFVLDVSGSMMAKFGDETRYEGAMEAIKQFTTYRPGDAFGLTVFGGEVLHWVPLTRDLSAIRMATPFLRPNLMPRFFNGTLIGKALRECQKVLEGRAEGERMIVLVSDGESADLSGGAADRIAAELRAANITVYHIHAADTAAPEDVHTIASGTGGAVFEARNPAALAEVFRRIDRMQSARMKPSAADYTDHFWPVAVAGLALCGLQLAASFGLRYTPW